MASCSTTVEKPPQAPLPEVPEYVRVPHPAGFDATDLDALFQAKSAPVPEGLQNCFDDMTKLNSFTNSRDELFNGAREFIADDPVKYHWCFYWTLYSLNQSLKKQEFWEQRQKMVLDAYTLLVPTAHGFHREFRDPRYLRWAMSEYRRISNWVFYRKLELTPQATALLVNTQIKKTNPLWRRPAEEGSILHKYGFKKNPEDIIAPPTAVPADEQRAPAEVTGEEQEDVLPPDVDEQYDSIDEDAEALESPGENSDQAVF